MKISLPHNWSPRGYQKKAWSALSRGVKRMSLCWHRRAGKDELFLQHNACAAFERVGNYWYMLPKYKQCRKAVWNAVNPKTGKKRIYDAFPAELISKVLDDEMIITFKNGSTFQLMGSDNFDSLVGAPPIGLTFSEYPISNPSAWGYLSPIVLENGGWSIFNGTPRGKNHFYRQMKSGFDDPEWFTETLTANDTDVFTPEQLQTELRRMQDEHDETFGHALWLQEYFCSFDAAIPGSIWGESMARLDGENKITSVPHKPGYPVHSAWDLGRDDATAIWFYQVIDGFIRIIGCYSNNFKDPDFYSLYLHKKACEGWRFGTHWLPHDAKPRRFGMGAGTIVQQFINLAKEIKDIGPKGIVKNTDISLSDDEKEKTSDIGKFAITPSFGVKEGIEAARKTFKICVFDVSCTPGLDSLRAYHREYDEERKKFVETPYHDWSSHYSDAFRYLSLTWRKSAEAQIILTPQQQLLGANITHLPLGKLKEQHFRKMRQKHDY